MSYVRESLTAGERVIAEFALHWMVWLPVAAWLMLGLATGGLLLPVAAYAGLQVLTLEMAVTNRRVILKRGIISRRADEMALHAIEAVDLDQSVPGRILGYANVHVTGRGISNVVFTFVAQPIAVKRAIDTASYNRVC